MTLKDRRILAVSLLLIVLMGFSVLNSACASKTEPIAPQSTQAAFAVSNLSVEPSEIEAGGEVAIVAEVSNTGGSEGRYTAELRVNGVAEATQNVTIPSGESVGITFRLSKDTPGAYEVALGGLTGQFVVTGSSALASRSATWSEALVTQLLLKEMPEFTVRIKPGNKATIEGGLIPITVSIGVSGGKIYFGEVPSMAYDYIAGGHAVFKTYTEYDGDKLWLTSLPPWVDPSKEFAPDVDRLPYVESVTTQKGEATLTYRWP